MKSIVAATLLSAAAAASHPYGEQLAALKEQTSHDVQTVHDLHNMVATLAKEDRHAFVADLGFLSDYVPGQAHRTLFRSAVASSRRMTDEACRDKYEAEIDAVTGDSDQTTMSWVGGTDACHTMGDMYVAEMMAALMDLDDGGDGDDGDDGGDDSDIQLDDVDCDDDSMYAAYACALDQQPIACAAEGDDDCNDSNWAWDQFGYDSGDGTGADGPADTDESVGDDDDSTPVYVDLDDASPGYNWESLTYPDLVEVEEECPDFATRCGNQAIACADMAADYTQPNCDDVSSDGIDISGGAALVPSGLVISLMAAAAATGML